MLGKMIWCSVRIIQFIPNMFNGVEDQGSVQITRVPTWANHVFMELLALCSLSFNSSKRKLKVLQLGQYVQSAFGKFMATVEEK